MWAKVLVVSCHWVGKAILWRNGRAQKLKLRLVCSRPGFDPNTAFSLDYHWEWLPKQFLFCGYSQTLSHRPQLSQLWLWRNTKRKGCFCMTEERDWMTKRMAAWMNELQCRGTGSFLWSVPESLISRVHCCGTVMVYTPPDTPMFHALWCVSHMQLAEKPFY